MIGIGPFLQGYDWYYLSGPAMFRFRWKKRSKNRI